MQIIEYLCVGILSITLLTAIFWRLIQKNWSKREYFFVKEFRDCHVSKFVPLERRSLGKFRFTSDNFNLHRIDFPTLYTAEKFIEGYLKAEEETIKNKECRKNRIVLNHPYQNSNN